MNLFDLHTNNFYMKWILRRKNSIKNCQNTLQFKCKVKSTFKYWSFIANYIIQLTEDFVVILIKIWNIIGFITFYVDQETIILSSSSNDTNNL
jgi:hypothetical protein